jgi:hypothetical protein
VTLSFHALWMLCALGAVVFAASAAPRLRQLLAMTIGFIAAAAVTSPFRLPDPSWVGVTTAAAAAIGLFRPRYALVSIAWGGALAGFLPAMLQVQTLHPVMAVAAPIGLIGMTIVLARAKTSFAPDGLRDEACVVICLLGIAVAMLPGVVDGWQAAANLTVAPAEGQTVAIPVWTLTLVATATALGATYSLWSRR